MIPKALATQTITVIRPAWVDDGHGNLVADWSAATEHDIDGWSVQPSSPLGDLDHRDAVNYRFRAFGPPDADVQWWDRVRWEGHVLEVTGAPIHWWSATGAINHTELALDAWEG